MTSDNQSMEITRVRATAMNVIVFSGVALIAGISRIWPPAFLMRPCADVLRWREALSMLVYAPLLVLILWRLFRVASNHAPDACGMGAFIAGAYFLGAGMGMHDICNLLGGLYRNAPPDLHRSLRFFDDRLGHWVFFAGFILACVSIGVAQTLHPLAQPMSRRLTARFVVLGVPMMFVMLTNLMWEKTGVDLCIIAGATLAIAGFHWRRRVTVRRLPILCVLYPAHAVAVTGTILYWIACRR